MIAVNELEMDCFFS